jgi:hypothetical protein
VRCTAQTFEISGVDPVSILTRDFYGKMDVKVQTLLKKLQTIAKSTSFGFVLGFILSFKPKLKGFKVCNNRLCEILHYIITLKQQYIPFLTESLSGAMFAIMEVVTSAMPPLVSSLTSLVYNTTLTSLPGAWTLLPTSLFMFQFWLYLATYLCRIRTCTSRQGF